MLSRVKQDILKQIKSMDGQTAICYKNLITGETFGYREEESFLPASIVKLPLMAAILLMEQDGSTAPDDLITVYDREKVPGCGAVQHMTGDVTLDIRTLSKLMITISDTTATNALFRHYGSEQIGQAFNRLGLSGTVFRRAYWDEAAEKKGIQNYFVPKEMCMLLEQMFFRKLISPKASAQLEALLLQQQINHKLGGFLPADFPIAHKTGEEEDKTHDVGIVYTKEPFVICFASCGADSPAFENFIRQSTLNLALEIDPDLQPGHRFTDEVISASFVCSG